MNTPFDGGSAFPQVVTDIEGDPGEYVSNTYSEGGMTLRDYFAAKAMAAYVNGCITKGLSWSPAEAAKEAHILADAMLKAREA